MLAPGDLTLKASVSFDRKNNRFKYNEEEFFELFQSDDCNQEEVKDAFSQIESMKQMAAIRPVPRPQVEVEANQEPISNYSAVVKDGDTSLIVVHA